MLDVSTTIDFAATCEDADPLLGVIGLPDGYLISKEGVSKESSKGLERVSGPIWATARTRSSDNRNFGLLLKFLDMLGGLHERVIRQGRLHEQSTTLVQELAGEGLFVQPGKENQLKTYLALSKPEIILQSVDRLGWSVNGSNQLVFVRPSETITASDGERVLFQPEAPATTAGTMVSAGDLDGYKRDVIERIADQPILLFFFFAALSGALLKPSQTETGGFHIHGRSTGGKTTALQVAASVWGSGADPQRNPEQSFCQRWNATSNGLEGIAAAHNDSALCLDELGTFGGTDFGGLIYTLLGGKGKNRMTQEASLRPVSTWRLLLLSTGEISIPERVKQDGKQLKDGHTVRMIDIPVGESLITRLDPRAAADLADTIKNAVGVRNYGTAGPALVKAIIKKYPIEADMRDAVCEQIEAAKMKLSEKIGRELPQTAKRVLQRFALVLAAAYLAHEELALPLSMNQIDNSVMSVLNLWLNNGIALVSESDRAIEHFREFCQNNLHRFADSNPIGAAARLSSNEVGYKLTSGNGIEFLCLTETGFKEACGGFTLEGLRSDLYKRELLHRPDSEHWKTKIALGGGDRPRLYKVDAKILDD